MRANPERVWIEVSALYVVSNRGVEVPELLVVGVSSAFGVKQTLILVSGLCILYGIRSITSINYRKGKLLMTQRWVAYSDAGINWETRALLVFIGDSIGWKSPRA